MKILLQVSVYIDYDGTRWRGRELLVMEAFKRIELVELRQFYGDIFCCIVYLFFK